VFIGSHKQAHKLLAKLSNLRISKVVDTWEWLRFFTQIEIFFAATKEKKNFKSFETYSEESIWINKATRVRVVTVNQL
jgi:hypothetical protein